MCVHVCMCNKMHIRMHWWMHTYAVKPLNSEHFGTSYNFTVIQRLSSFRGKIVLPWSCGLVLYREVKCIVSIIESVREIYSIP